MGDLVEFPRRSIGCENAPRRYDPLTAEYEPVTRCEPPTIHVYSSAETGAVCQCGEHRWVDVPGHENINWSVHE